MGRGAGRPFGGAMRRCATEPGSGGAGSPWAWAAEARKKEGSAADVTEKRA